MNPSMLLIPFVASIAISIPSKKAGYVAILVSSLLLASYGILSMGLSTVAFFYIISAIVLVLCSLYSIKYDQNNKWLGRLFPVAAFGVALILLSNNYLEFLAGWEVMSISGYLMVGLYKEEPGPAFGFAAFGELSTIFIIAGMAYAYVLTGTFAFTSLPNAIPLALIAIGAFVKMGILPFLIGDWLPISESKAPATSAAIMSALMTLMAVFITVIIALRSPSNLLLGAIFMAIGAFTVFFAALFEYISENTRILLGYSTIENNGAILIAIGLLIASPPGIMTGFFLSVILILCLAHSTAKTGMFLMSGSLGGTDLGEIKKAKDFVTMAGEILVAASLSGLLPTIGGVATWMLLESLFATAAISTTWLSILVVIVGALVALGESIASGAMIKFVSYTQLFMKDRNGRPSNTYAVLLAGLSVVILGIISVMLINQHFVIGNTAVGIPEGTLIASILGTSSTFGVVSPIFIAILLCAFMFLAVLIFRRPRTRRVPTWNNGLDKKEDYTSFAFANNIRIMMGRIFRTDQTATKKNVTKNVFWSFVVGCAAGYRRMAGRITWKFMNSSISSYIGYLIIAFVFALIFVILIGG